ncbi:hypothetical protein [Marinobacter sp. ATCH36]|uniref:hypothetical protein n=1 Tax=Marinobacter sp. ATCH36 TaxID=2945106 RepID=UPI002020CAE2|nr:hypothetical protein [Marinobacter sp. ATCH36]MCL7945392.1 hypothetical protein [Marinobacter sp. ATCH36]
MSHSGNKYQWRGPLDEVALSKYEGDGFLWFEGFFNPERPDFLGARKNTASLPMYDNFPELA